MNNNHR